MQGKTDEYVEDKSDSDDECDRRSRTYSKYLAASFVTRSSTNRYVRPTAVRVCMPAVCVRLSVCFRVWLQVFLEEPVTRLRLARRAVCSFLWTSEVCGRVFLSVYFVFWSGPRDQALVSVFLCFDSIRWFSCLRWGTPVFSDKHAMHTLSSTLARVRSCARCFVRMHSRHTHKHTTDAPHPHTHSLSHTAIPHAFFLSCYCGLRISISTHRYT